MLGNFPQAYSHVGLINCALNLSRQKGPTEERAGCKRLSDATENSVADLSDPMLRDRIAELKSIRDQAGADAERAEDAIERLGPSQAGPEADADR
jgi:hypothetical protein